MNVSVRIATENTTNLLVLIIGETNTVWNRPHIAITSCLMSYGGNFASNLGGWTTTLVTSLAGYSASSVISNSAIAT
jgi:hypothetical protein